MKRPHRQRGVPQAEPAAGDVAGRSGSYLGWRCDHTRPRKRKARKQNANDPQHDARRRNGGSSLASVGCSQGRKHGFGRAGDAGRTRRTFLAPRAATYRLFLSLIRRVVVASSLLFVGVTLLGLRICGNATIRGGNRFVSYKKEIILAAHF